MEQCSGTAEAEGALFAHLSCLCVPALCCVHHDSASAAVDCSLSLLILPTLRLLFTGGFCALAAASASLWVLVSNIQTTWKEDFVGSVCHYPEQYAFDGQRASPRFR